MKKTNLIIFYNPQQTSWQGNTIAYVNLFQTFYKCPLMMKICLKVIAFSSPLTSLYIENDEMIDISVSNSFQIIFSIKNI